MVSTLNRSCSRTFLSLATLTATLALAAPATAQPPADPAAPPPDPAAPVESAPPPPPPATGGLKIDGNNASLKLGFLAQPGFQMTDGAATSGAMDVSTTAFFMRRARILLGFTLGSNLELFADTDVPNLGGPGPTGVAGTTGMHMQDVFVTWKIQDELKIDVGMMLIPFVHNALQGATTLYSWDYFSYPFLGSTALGNFIGRDNGVQARGLVGGHLEYRVGVFTGRRVAMPDVSRTAPRIAARLQYNVFDPETAFFYGGTYGGSKKILSFGIGFDKQKTYTGVGGDIFFDWPNGIDTATWQLNLVYFDGGGPTPPTDIWSPVVKQTALMTEAGYRFGAVKLSPIIRFEMTNIDTPTVATPNQRKIGAGLAWWYMGHNANIKLFWNMVSHDVDSGTPGADTLQSYNQINLQMQFFVF